LGGLIKLSDTVVFVVSPEAVKSEICGWEVDKTLALSKRLLPGIYKSVPDAEIPPKLGEMQFISFHTAPGVMRPLRELAEALRVDLQWIREHTGLGNSQRAGTGEDVPNRYFCAETNSTRRKHGWPPATRQRLRSPTRSAPLSKPAKRRRARGWTKSASS